jgi:hypothetical protein
MISGAWAKRDPSRNSLNLQANCLAEAMAHRPQKGIADLERFP